MRPSENEKNPAGQGSVADFNTLVDCYAPEMYRLALALVGNAADAEDVMQEAFAGAFRAWETFEGRSSARTWLTRIVIRHAAKCRSRRARRVVSLDAASRTEVTPRGEPSASAVDHGARLDVMAALQALSEEHREVIVLREFQGMSYDEMAEALGVPRGTVESRLFRARQELRTHLHAYRT